MGIKNDLDLDVSKHMPSAVSKRNEAFNEELIKTGKSGPRWYEVRL